MNSIFPRIDNSYNLQRNPTFRIENIRTTYYGSETLMYQGPITWEPVPQNIKEANDLNESKRKIKLWKPEGYLCRMCKVYIPNLGVI